MTELSQPGPLWVIDDLESDAPEDAAPVTCAGCQYPVGRAWAVPQVGADYSVTWLCPRCRERLAEQVVEAA